MVEIVVASCGIGRVQFIGMNNDMLLTQPHRRLNVLTGEWVLVSPHRAQRPWQGSIEHVAPTHLPSYDPGCYLCPGNMRASGSQNPSYTNTFVFTNDFAALMPETQTNDGIHEKGMLIAEHERGICRVVCYSPQHNMRLATMEPSAIRQVVDVWVAHYEELAALPWVSYVQIFENSGAMMGASNPHPHGQIWANERLPNEIVKELHQQRAYMVARGQHLLADYLALERSHGTRLVCENKHFCVLVPFWAIWPFETLVLPRATHGALSDLHTDERDSLADILSRLTRCYDKLFDAPFPYSMGIHQRPTDGEPQAEWILHLHFYPPLLRSATVRKFMVGYEMLCQPQRDVTPEMAAERLRQVCP